MKKNCKKIEKLLQILEKEIKIACKIAGTRNSGTRKLGTQQPVRVWAGFWHRLSNFLGLGGLGFPCIGWVPGYPVPITHTDVHRITQSLEWHHMHQKCFTGAVSLAPLEFLHANTKFLDIYLLGVTPKLHYSNSTVCIFFDGSDLLHWLF